MGDILFRNWNFNKKKLLGMLLQVKNIHHEKIVKSRVTDLVQKIHIMEKLPLDCKKKKLTRSALYGLTM